jgi:hypothetical protein
VSFDGTVASFEIVLAQNESNGSNNGIVLVHNECMRVKYEVVIEYFVGVRGRCNFEDMGVRNDNVRTENDIVRTNFEIVKV